MREPIDEVNDLGPVSGRDLNVLKVIEEEDLTSFSFEGLKRRIHTHPETLSRALERLEEQSIVERAEGNYRLTPKGREYLGLHPADGPRERLTILKTMLPPSLSVQQVLHDLRGKWFGTLRWLGYSESGGDLVMKWVTDDGNVQLDARFTPLELTIEGRLLQGRELAGAVRAAHQLLAHITKFYTRPKTGRVLLFEAFPPYLMPN